MKDGYFIHQSNYTFIHIIVYSWQRNYILPWPNIKDKWIFLIAGERGASTRRVRSRRSDHVVVSWKTPPWLCEYTSYTLSYTYMHPNKHIHKAGVQLTYRDAIGGKSAFYCRCRLAMAVVLYSEKKNTRKKYNVTRTAIRFVLPCLRNSAHVHACVRIHVNVISNIIVAHRQLSVIYAVSTFIDIRVFQRR